MSSRDRPGELLVSCWHAEVEVVGCSGLSFIDHRQEWARSGGLFRGWETSTVGLLRLIRDNRKYTSKVCPRFDVR